jgi:aspartate/methionine/tyrosine aminotransferase
MRIAELKIETFFAEYEFATEYVMCGSDAEALPMRDLIAMADPESRELWDNLVLGYTETWGHPLLREAIAGQYAHLSPENVLVFSGAQDAIFCMMNAELHPGDHVVVATPCWQPLYEVPVAAGADVTRVRMDNDSGFGFDLSRIANAVRADTRMIVVNAPNNPTGALPTRAEFDELRRLSDEVGATLVSDEIYRLLEHDPADRLPAAAEISDTGVSIGVVSKVYGLPGARIGWLASKNVELLRRAAGMKHYTTICAAAPSELLALIALRNADQVLAAPRSIARANLALLDEFFDRHRELATWSRPGAGTVAFPRFRLDMPTRSFVDLVRRGPGVLLLPGDVFDEPDGYVRIGYGRRNMPQALERLDEFLNSSREVTWSVVEP